MLKSLLVNDILAAAGVRKFDMEDAIFPSKQSRKPNSSLPKKINNQNKERKAIDIARIRDGRRGEVWLKGVGEKPSQRTEKPTDN